MRRDKNKQTNRAACSLNKSGDWPRNYYYYINKCDTPKGRSPSPEELKNDKPGGPRGTSHPEKRKVSGQKKE